MLKYLELNNFILVKSLKLDFSRGLQVLTGETGAGKSIIVGAIQLIMGEQLRGSVFRNPDEKVVLSATFSVSQDNKSLLDLLDKYDVDISDGEIFFSREISPDNRSTVFINGRRVTNAIIREFRDSLFDFHGQRDQQLLLNEDFQLLCLDHYAQLDDEREAFSKLYFEYQRLIREHRKLVEEEKKNNDKIKLYEYQINEIEELRLRKDEEEELDTEYQVLANANEILNINRELNEEFYEKENSIFDQISSIAHSLQQYAKMNKLIGEQSENLQSILANFEDLIQISRQIPGEIYLDQERLEEVEQRLQVLYQIKTKYKRSLIEIIEYKEEMQTYLKEHSSLQDTIAFFAEEIIKTSSELLIRADELSAKRKAASERFSREIEANLHDLAIPEANIKIIVDKIDGFCKDNHDIVVGLKETGYDQVSYLFNANKGGHLQLLKHSASGGELSRLLLVIKKILAENLPPQTVIFDEIDSGIGGNTANMLGEYIQRISDYHQVICITHLAQVASYANNHYKIEKDNESDKTEIKVAELSFDEQEKEIARMLSGNISDSSLKHAKELLFKRR
ncbi:MAG: DNA repair protein RecN [Candidatus Cloacimonetes bacterium]|nr:DNA repair protein RecN [Candidatus Cloacimonadota bacterium]MDD3501690.1 DNA repair protein RecN [Candidatus Cloacimonadota bacterium]